MGALIVGILMIGCSVAASAHAYKIRSDPDPKAKARKANFNALALLTGSLGTLLALLGGFLWWVSSIQEGD